MPLAYAKTLSDGDFRPQKAAVKDCSPINFATCHRFAMCIK